MSGHSHWATIRRKKGAKDAKRGKLFSKLARSITLAARGGSDPDTNFKLRYAIDQARSQGLPKDNMERAIRRGSGEEAGPDLDEVTYEGMGPEGIQLIVEALTDNRNRTTAELRKLFERKGGKLGAPNSVAWNFDAKGRLVIPAEKVDEEELFDLVVEAGAESCDRVEEEDGAYFEVVCAPEDLESIRKAVTDRDLEPMTCELTRVAKTTVKIDSEGAAGKVLAMVGELEDHEDVQSVSANFDIPDQLMARLE
jgi:YebC/PmpR family DNA-binding regulatory protein